jgi:hypothetical protein
MQAADTPHSFTCHSSSLQWGQLKPASMCGSCDNTKPTKLSDDRDENDIPIPMETIDSTGYAFHNGAAILPREYRDIIWSFVGVS